MNNKIIIIAVLLALVAIVPVITTISTVYAKEWYPYWDEAKQYCEDTGGEWKHAFCVYDED